MWGRFLRFLLGGPWPRCSRGARFFRSRAWKPSDGAGGRRRASAVLAAAARRRPCRADCASAALAASRGGRIGFVEGLLCSFARNAARNRSLDPILGDGCPVAESGSARRSGHRRCRGSGAAGSVAAGTRTRDRRLREVSCESFRERSSNNPTRSSWRSKEGLSNSCDHLGPPSSSRRRLQKSGDSGTRPVITKTRDRPRQHGPRRHHGPVLVPCHEEIRRSSATRPRRHRGLWAERIRGWEKRGAPAAAMWMGVCSVRAVSATTAVSE